MTLPELPTVVSIFGLVLTGAGAYIAARALILKPDDAIEIGLARYAGANREENLKLPFVRSLLRQSKHAKWGLYLVAIGTVFQIVGAVLSAG